MHISNVLKEFQQDFLQSHVMIMSVEYHQLFSNGMMLLDGL